MTISFLAIAAAATIARANARAMIRCCALEKAD
jgi:hypothetical protein